MRINYWSNSKLADWIRGSGKPDAATGTGWRDWKKAAKADHPVRFWIAEDLLDHLQDIANWPLDKIDNLRYYINNRWVTKTHALTAHPRDIPRGKWHDVGNRFLPCLFNELVDFVEIELAWANNRWNDKPNYPWWRRWYRNWRSAEDGMAYLNWAKDLDDRDFIEEGQTPQPTGQALAAKEIIELYTWWTKVRPNRADPYDVSGWTEYCEKTRAAHGGDLFASLGSKTAEEEQESRAMLDKINQLEADYEAEDEAMLIRLIKIRDHLWT